MPTILSNLKNTPGRIDGVAIPAGVVGERKTWAIAPSNQNTTTSYADWTNADISLSPGVWQVFASITGYVSCAAVIGAASAVTVAITDISNNIVQEMEKQMQSQTRVAASIETVGCLSFSFVANVSTTTVYKLRVKRADGGGAGAGGLLNVADQRSNFYAVRIA